ncbi:MAG: putative Ig domain-containing protein [Candidatus Nanopelagicales bacterium]
MGFFALGPARFNFSSSAVGANASLAGGGPVLFGNTAAFTSDALTWVQPTPSQDASALRSILPLVITHPPGLKPDSWNQGPYLSAVTPLLGAPTGPGVLIDAVPDASGVNKLINPIDGSTITTDVLGNARVDANGKRNIGAVQLTYAPELSVGDPTKSTLTARWTRPLDPPSGPITGYRLSYRVKGSGAPFTSVALSGADTLQTVVTGLIPDTDYEFVVVAVNASGDGPPSATVTGRTSPDPHLDYADGKGRVGTKFDPLDPHTRDVSAPRIYTSFDGDLPPGLKLSRDTGEIAGTPTKAGKYVFQVAVTGGNNAQATTTVTITISEKPAPADPHLDYPEGKGRVSKKFDPLDPQTRDVPAPRTYTVSDRDLPPGLKLSRDTGEIAGTPTKAGKYVFKVAVTGGNNARATATVTITISDPDYPTLSYPAGEGEQGTKLVPLDPHVSGLTGQLKFAIVDGRLPDGVTMDEDTGEITGTPREHGAFTIKVKVTGREGSATTTTTVGDPARRQRRTCTTARSTAPSVSESRTPTRTLGG